MLPLRESSRSVLYEGMCALRRAFAIRRSSVNTSRVWEGLSTEGEGSPVAPLPKAPFLLLPTFTARLALAFPPVLSPDCTYTHCEAASLPPSFLAASMP